MHSFHYAAVQHLRIHCAFAFNVRKDVNVVIRQTKMCMDVFFGEYISSWGHITPDYAGSRALGSNGVSDPWVAQGCETRDHIHITSLY